MDKSEVLKDVKLFVLDMDGTFYLEDEIIEGSLEFLKKVIETKRDYIFFTNNSSKNSKFYQERLAKMGLNISRGKIITSGDVSIKYINTFYPNKKVFLVGTPYFKEDCINKGLNLVDDKADIVLMSFDTTLTYEKLDKACSLIRKGATFLSTHLDLNCPTKEGFMIDCGSMCEAIKASTGVSPKYLGKPFKETLDMVIEITGYKKEEIAFVGDRIYTDVKTGVNNGVKGFLVLSGEASLKDVEVSQVKPTEIYENLYEISKYL